MRRFEEGEIDYLTNMAMESGFTHTIDLHTVYDKIDIESILLAPWDYHPNVKGHQLISNHFYDVFTASTLAKDIEQSFIAANHEK